MEQKTHISYDEAGMLFDKYLKTGYLRHHSRETEVIMRALALQLGEDAEFWGICGLLHDLDLDEIGDDMQRHGTHTVELLKAANYNIPELFNAILAHVEGIPGLSYSRSSRLEYILAGAENITGLITAYVILRPDKKIAGTKVSSLMKKFKSPAFAAKVNRDFIRDAALHAGMELTQFMEIAVSAMEGIAGETGMA
ncbi:MAG: HD domain-containing protein [Candidatus Marinimicrobia bacterium]|nr:HD domain-containing protein [Candidatus Neomarinimicrobiota bacterium]